MWKFESPGIWESRQIQLIKKEKKNVKAQEEVF